MTMLRRPLGNTGLELPILSFGASSLGAEFRKTFAAAGVKIELQPIEKWAFYEAVRTPDYVLTIQTADQQRFANLLLSVGVRMD